MAAFLLAAYDEDVINDEPRTVLRLHPRLAPYKVAVLPLSKKPELTGQSEMFSMLADRYMVDYDETQAIGRRYRRQDEVGTPLCVTVDFDSLEDNAVTIRERELNRTDPRPDRRPAVGHHRQTRFLTPRRFGRLGLSSASAPLRGGLALKSAIRGVLVS